jgi:hypothetical protein
MLLASAGKGAGTAAAAGEAGARAGGLGSVRSSVASTLLVVLLVVALGFAAYALLASLVAPRPGLWALSKGAGVLLFGFVPWLLVSLGLLRFQRPALLAVAAVFVALGASSFRRRLALPDDLLGPRRSSAPSSFSSSPRGSSTPRSSGARSRWTSPS